MPWQQMQQTKMFRNRNKRNCRIQGTEKDNLNVMQPPKGLELMGEWIYHQHGHRDRLVITTHMIPRRNEHDVQLRTTPREWERTVE